LLGVSLYAAHVIAIACGGKPPYVEENYRFAEQCLWVTAPSGLGVMAGAGVRVILASLGRFPRRQGPPVRFLPRTTRDLMVTVACVGIGLGCLHRMMFPPTVFAARYDEGKFQAIRPGLTSGQVISVLGPPLEKEPRPEGQEKWAYSKQYTYTSNYERRWIFFKDGLVQDVVSDYWVD
jgi:hypothetical protein